MKNGKRVLFEGAQGTLLDLDHGTYPFVTSSNCVSANAATGTGISPQHIKHVLGICKAYITRVGTGPFPTELLDATGERIRGKGGEYGIVTGRPRRCGWLDLVALRYALRLNGAKFLTVTKLDVLTGLETIKVCTEYRLGEKKIDSIPANAGAYSMVEPLYAELSGWDEPEEGWISIIKAGYQSLPDELKMYLKFIEEKTNSKVAIISLGPDRDETLIIPDVLNFSDV